MVYSADEYYVTFTRGIPHADVTRWEQQIVDAEARRMDDRAVMDMIGATKPSAETPITPLTTDISQDPIVEWIQLALVIEEKQ